MNKKKNKKKSEDITVAITVTAAILLGYIMAVSLIATSAWETSDINEIPMHDVADSLFNEFGFVLVILGLLLSAAVIGGIFLAKMEVKD